MTVIHVVSVSGGKDSDETLRQAVARFPKDRVLPIYCDTGNEHEAVDEHLAYLETRLGVAITRLKANFDSELATKRMFIARDVRTRRDEKGRREVFADLNIWSRIEWSKTTRGGKQYDMLNEPQTAQCASAYGLCE